MVSGRRPFGGATDLEVLKTIIHGAPKPLRAGIPLELRMVMEKALEKDPAERYQTMRDMVVDLRRAARAKPEEADVPAASARRQPRRIGWASAIAVGLASALAGYAVHAALAKRTSKQNVQLRRLTDLVGLEEAPAMSPDGKIVPFVAAGSGKRQIWIRLFSGGKLLPITTDDTDHYGPRWSPDSSSLIYFTPGVQPRGSGTLWEIGALGGPPRPLASALTPGDVSHDGKRIAFLRFQDGATELAVAARDQTSSLAVAKLPAGVYTNVRWSPDDLKIAYLHNGPLSFSNLMVADLSGGEPRRVAGGDVMIQGFAWTPDGAHLIVSSAQRTAQCFTLRRTISGPSHRTADRHRN